MSRCNSRCLSWIVPASELSVTDARSSISLSTYIISSLRLPKANVFACKSNNIPLIVHDTRPCASRADIDTNVVLLMRMDLVARIGRHLA